MALFSDFLRYPLQISRIGPLDTRDPAIFPNRTQYAVKFDISHTNLAISQAVVNILDISPTIRHFTHHGQNRRYWTSSTYHTPAWQLRQNDSNPQAFDPECSQKRKMGA